MNKKLKWVSLSILIIAAAAFFAFTPQQKNKEKQEQNQGKKDTKNQPGNDDRKNQPEKNPNKNNNGNNDNNGNGNGGKNKDRENEGNAEDNMTKGNNGNKIPEYGYDWDREKFKDRKKFRDQEKVTVCHKFNRDNDPAVAIRVSSNALKAHLNHGDIIGNCPVVANPRYSDGFMKKRTDYYNDIQQSQEQVLYSRSILDYAVARLADSRAQLSVSQNNNMPQTNLAQRQAAVTELEQNVSLLESVLGVAANLLVNKLQQ